MHAGAIGSTVSSANNWGDSYTGTFYDTPMEACTGNQNWINAHPSVGYILSGPSVIPPASPTGYWNCLYGATGISTQLPFATTTSLIYRKFFCPAHSSLVSTDQISGGTCACFTQYNFIPDATGTKCVCPEDQQLDPTGIRCVPETYTIALSGLGGDVLSGATRPAFAVVTTNAGTPKSGAQVSLVLSVVPDNDGQPPVAHEGRLTPVAGSTGADGRFNFTFTAPVAGGTHTITATCTNCTNNPVTGTIIVPVCPIADLPPITDPEVQAFEDNPNRSDTAHLTPAMQTALQGLIADASAAGGAPSVGSAFRPPAYNQHLIDVWEKWVNDLREEMRPECAALKAKIRGHFQRHGLLESQQPVANSRHTRGLAVDVSISLPSANIDALAQRNGLRRPLPVDDPVHFQFP